ncbi:aminotransferase [Paracoccaceae bacterium]|nr:aminotransferase [Paracoccaceae bacterium]
MNKLVNSIEAKDIANHIHPYTNPEVLQTSGPHVITKGEGIYVYDNSGNKYIEGMSGLWCASLGFNNNELVEAATEQMKKLPFYHSFAGKVPDIAAQLSEKLISIAPKGLEKAFFCNSGSEANDTAVKIVWYYQSAMGRPEKKKIISRKRGYHGVTMVAGSLTGLPYAQDGFGLPLEFVRHIGAPHFFTEKHENEIEEMFVERLVKELEDLIEAENPNTIGAFIAEPVMGAGGVIIPPKKYFKRIQETLKKNDILFIVDEVICGFGRSGNMWGTETFNLKPDILTCAKALSSAYAPIAAVLMSNQIVSIIEKKASNLGVFGHGFTYSAHPVSSAVALKTLQIYEDSKIIDHVGKLQDFFIARVKELKKYDFIGDARAIGLLGAIEFVSEPNTNSKPDPKRKVATKIQQKIQDEGVILRALPGDSLAFCPPLIIEKNQIDQMFNKIDSALSRINFKNL